MMKQFFKQWTINFIVVSVVLSVLVVAGIVAHKLTVLFRPEIVLIGVTLLLILIISGFYAWADTQ